MAAKRRGRRTAPQPAAPPPAAPWSATLCVFAALIALAVGLTPFGSSQAADLPLLSLGLTALCAAVLCATPEGLRALLTWRVARAGAGLLAWSFVAAVVSGRPASALLGAPGSMTGWLALAAVAATVALLAASADGARRALGAVAPWVLIVEGLFAAWEFGSGRHASGTMSNSSYLGLVVALLLPLVARTALDRTRPVERRITAGVAIAGGLLSLLAGDARAAIAVIAAWGGVAFAVRAGGRRSPALARTLGLTAAAAAAVAGAVALLTARPGSAVSVFLADRLRWWAPAVEAIRSRPLTGFGPDGYPDAVYGIAGADSLNAGHGFAQVSTDPHNLLLAVVVSIGLVGVVLFGWLAFEVARNWALQARAADGEGALPFVTGALLYVAIVMTTPAALQTLPLFAVVLGASLRVESPKRPDVVPPAAAGVARAFALTVAVLVILLALTRLSIERVDRPDRGDPRLTQALASVWRADPFLYYRASIDWAYAAQREPSLAEGRPDLAAIRRAVEIEPRNPIYRTELARTLAYHSEPPSVVEPEFQAALELFPGSADTRAGYAEYLMAQGRMEDAGRLIEEGLSRAEPITLLEVAERYHTATGDTEAAAKMRRRIEAARAQAAARGF